MKLSIGAQTTLLYAKVRIMKGIAALLCLSVTKLQAQGMMVKRPSITSLWSCSHFPPAADSSNLALGSPKPSYPLDGHVGAGQKAGPARDWLHAGTQPRGDSSAPNPEMLQLGGVPFLTHKVVMSTLF